MDYVEDANGYRITAEYTGDLLTNLSASNGDRFSISYNNQGRISDIVSLDDIRESVIGRQIRQGK